MLPCQSCTRRKSRRVVQLRPVQSIGLNEAGWHKMYLPITFKNHEHLPKESTELAGKATAEDEIWGTHATFHIIACPTVSLKSYEIGLRKIWLATWLKKQRPFLCTKTEKSDRTPKKTCILWSNNFPSFLPSFLLSCLRNMNRRNSNPKMYRCDIPSFLHCCQ